MKIFPVFIFFLLLTGLSDSLAQKNAKHIKNDASYIILLYGDTLYGKISTDVSGHVKFKHIQGSETEKYKPDELIGYFLAKKGQTFITINPDDDNHGPWLYERKANGIIKMYSYVFEGSNGGRLPFYYVERESSGLKRVLKGSVISIKKEKDVLRDFMGDSDEIMGALKKAGWNEKSLLKIITQYNEWYVQNYPEE